MPADIAPIAMEQRPGSGSFLSSVYMIAGMFFFPKSSCNTFARRSSPARTTTRYSCFKYASTSSAAACALPPYDGSCFAEMLVSVFGATGQRPVVKESAMYTGHSGRVLKNLSVPSLKLSAPAAISPRR